MLSRCTRRLHLAQIPFIARIRLTSFRMTSSSSSDTTDKSDESKDRAATLQSRVFDYWFKGITAEGAVPPATSGLWFGRSAEIDKKIKSSHQNLFCQLLSVFALREDFEEDITLAAAGKYKELEAKAESALAVVRFVPRATS